MEIGPAGGLKSSRAVSAAAINAALAATGAKLEVGGGGLYIPNASAAYIALNGRANGDIVAYGNGRIGFTLSTTNANGVAPDAYITRDGVGILAQRDGANPQGFRVYSTFTDTSNYERFGVRYSGGAWTLGHEFAGTGASRLMRFGAGSYIEVDDGPGTVSATRGAGSSSNTIFQVTATGLTSTVLLFTRLTPSINQASGTYTVLDINPTETAVGAGPHFLIKGRIGAGINVFGIKNDGAIQSGDPTNGVQFKNNGGTEAVFTRADGTTAITVKAGQFRSTGGTVSGAGAASGIGTGGLYYATDLTSTTRGATAAGGGSLKGFIASDGTNWIIV